LDLFKKAGFKKGRTACQQLASAEKDFDRAALEMLYRSQGANGTFQRMAVLQDLRAGKLTLPKVESKPQPTTPSAPRILPPVSPTVDTEDVDRLQKANVSLAADLQRKDAELAALTKNLVQAQSEVARARADLAQAQSTVEERASQRAQQILAACGAPAVQFTKTNTPARVNNPQGLTGLKRVVAETKKQIQAIENPGSTIILP
jgi:hypothetical protein